MFEGGVEVIPVRLQTVLYDSHWEPIFGSVTHTHRYHKFANLHVLKKVIRQMCIHMVRQQCPVHWWKGSVRMQHGSSATATGRIEGGETIRVIEKY